VGSLRHRGRALFVSRSYPDDFQCYRSGIFVRMHVLLQALRASVDELSVLFFVEPPADTSAAAARAARTALASRWGIDADVELAAMADQRPARGRVAQYLAPIFNPGSHRGFERLGPEQVAVIQRHLAGAPDVVFVHRLNCMPAVLAAGAPRSTVLLDLDDIEHKKFWRDIAQPPRWPGKRLYYLHVPAFALVEARLLRQARRVYVCSRLDGDYLRRSFGLGNLALLPNSVLAPAEPGGPCAEETVAFVGSYWYEPNVIAADHLITNIWPAIHRARPQARLLIVGNGPEAIPSFGRPPEGVEFLGFVEDMAALYRRVKVVACTVLSGGGTRTKILDAAAHGRPIVSSHVGAEGIDLQDGQEILLHDDPAEFAAACVRLLQDDDLCRAMGRAAHRAVRERYERSQVVEQVTRDIVAATR
jgi:glycosyltransferase involved in cell wall biosynthesis